MNAGLEFGGTREVVVAMANGQQLRGHVSNLNPQKQTFSIQIIDDNARIAMQDVRFDAVKMVAFLKTGRGEPNVAPDARVITLRFTDGQVIRGVSLPHGNSQVGIYLAPLNAENIERAFIPVSAIREVLGIQKLGEILAQQGAVTPQQVDQAAKKQEEVRTEPLGSILVRRQVITEEQLRESLKLQRQHPGSKKLGEILLEHNFVEQSQIDEALEVQKTQRRKKFGEILVDMGFASYKTIAIALAMQCNIPFLDLSTQAIHPQLATVVPANVARRWQIMPINLQQGILTVAVTDPIDHPGIETLRKTTGQTVIMVIATPQDIASAISTYYGKASRT